MVTSTREVKPVCGGALFLAEALACGHSCNVMRSRKLLKLTYQPYPEKGIASVTNPNLKSFQKQPQRRSAEVTGVDIEARTVELAFSSETEVVRHFGIEILSHGKGSCNLSRLNTGGPVLMDHDRVRQVGVVEKAWIGADYVGRARVKFSRSAGGQEVLQDIIDGVRQNVSVGYTIRDARYTGERDGMDVVLVTDWEPYEISIVSIPADAAVGIGRAADASNIENNKKKTGSMPTKSSSNARNGTGRNLTDAVMEVMKDAANANSVIARQPAGFSEPIAYIPTGTARALVASLKGDSLPGLFDANGRIIRTPHAVPSSEEFSLEAAILANSRVSRAGAGIIVVDEATKAHAVGRTGEIALESTPGYLRHVDSAVWSTVDVDSLAQVPESVSPITTATIDWKTSTAKGVRFTITRSHRMTYMDQQKMVGLIMSALTLGLARAADEVLLSALAAEGLQPFTLARVAATDLAFDDLRALVGTNGAGAVVGQDGILRAAGVRAELTPDMTGTIAGDFARASVAVLDNVNIYMERGGLAGQMIVTAWAAMQPLVPVAGKFWTVA